MDIVSLQQIIGQLCRTDAGSMQPHRSLRSFGITASLGLSIVRSQIEARTATKLPVITVETTVAELLALATGGDVGGRPSLPVEVPARPPTASTRATDDPSMGGSRVLGLGLDLQDIDALPRSADFRTDPFYAANFSPSELATAMLRPDPRAHLCGMFCAKEAAKKSHPALIDLRMDSMVVGHDQGGRPVLSLLDPSIVLSFTISITHTSTFAAATCLTQDSRA